MTQPFSAGAERRSAAVPASASNSPPPVTAGAVLSAADYAELMQELDDLRSRHRGEVSQRLREAREFGSPGDDDDRLAIHEDVAFTEARIAQLEHLARFATVVAVDDVAGVAALGSVVRVADGAGATIEFRLVGRRTADAGLGDVSLASPVGKALTGVRAGDVARVRCRTDGSGVLTVLEVVAAGRSDQADPTAEAA